MGISFIVYARDISRGPCLTERMETGNCVDIGCMCWDEIGKIQTVEFGRLGRCLGGIGFVEWYIWVCFMYEMIM